MDYRINTYNEDYIMINTYDIFKAHLKELADRNSQENIFIGIHSSIFAYENMKGLNHYHSIKEIAVNKHSEISNYLLTNQKKPEYITIEQIIHALLICIAKREWKYYDDLTYLTKNYTAKYFKEIEYERFKLSHGEEITEYIINSEPYSIKAIESDKDVYLYENDKIIKTELPSPSINKRKTRTKTK